jgi:hypothetical protein
MAALYLFQVAKSALPHVVPAVDSLKADESAISELLNLAWAGHEMTDEYLDEVGDDLLLLLSHILFTVQPTKSFRVLSTNECTIFTHLRVYIYFRLPMGSRLSSFSTG